jgi:peptidoglycan/xylan/chitin deacetylase (PgdA/CDA1 family)
MRIKKMLHVSIGVFAVVVAVGYSVFTVSRSRTFQLFGEIIPRVSTTEKVAALTFDDGPTKYTRDVLQILEKKEVKATFFVVGRELEKNKEIGKALVMAGHELGNHTYTHQRMWFKSPAFIAREIEDTNTLIREAGYRGAIHFRPPYSKKLLLLPWYLSRHNIKTIMVDVEPDTYGADTDFLVSYTLEHTQPGSIILLHPFCDACSGQRGAIEKIIDGLRSKGYRLVTVSELLTYGDK